ncbi:MAG: hypothetical protein QM579_02140 [Desulfovibrio sp.]|uniref:hypothetical protein n=1 Tax=Desulfovibrio sp. TaxID=885 RepID=UPI0039E62F61
MPEVKKWPSDATGWTKGLFSNSPLGQHQATQNRAGQMLKKYRNIGQISAFTFSAAL